MPCIDMVKYISSSEGLKQTIMQEAQKWETSGDYEQELQQSNIQFASSVLQSFPKFMKGKKIGEETLPKRGAGALLHCFLYVILITVAGFKRLNPETSKAAFKILRNCKAMQSVDHLLTTTTLAARTRTQFIYTTQARHFVKNQDTDTLATHRT